MSKKIRLLYAITGYIDVERSDYEGTLGEASNEAILELERTDPDGFDILSTLEDVNISISLEELDG